MEQVEPKDVPQSPDPKKYLPSGVTKSVIDEQLERIRSSSQFRSSRRCIAFLDYVVEVAVNGDEKPLKERTIGIDVFGRDPDYDTNHDPVVRGTASEIRKRLAQYYQSPGHEQELRIELCAGSYLPEFRPAAATLREEAAPSQEISEAVTAAVINSPATATVASEEGQPLWNKVFQRRWFRVVPIVAAVAVVLAITFFITRKPTAKAYASLLDQFWAPVLESPRPVLLCLGQPTVYNLLGSLHTEVDQALAKKKRGGGGPGASPKLLIDPSQIAPSSDRYVAIGDAACLSSLSALFARKGRDYNIRGGGSTTFADLRENTTVLIGGFTNDWTMRLTGKLRYTLEDSPDGDTHFVQDRLHPENRSWQLKHIWPEWKMPLDYAIVSRILDPNTQKVVVTAAGITQYGTAAAGEFLTNPEYLSKAFRQVPSDWQRKNIQVVISTEVIDGTAGPPQVLATYFQ